jgi:DNA polymerase elongation subunit (family B)
MECLHCHTTDPHNLEKHKANKHGITRIYCKRCQKNSRLFAAPKILLLDIERSKARFALYAPGKQYVSWRDMTAETYITGWAAKWLFDPETQSAFVTPKEAKARNDTRIVTKLYKLMNEADMIVAHNGNGFDFPILYATFARYNLPPNNRQLTLDTYRKAKQVFKLPSYSLGYLLQYFGCAPKGKREDTDLAEAGDKKALQHDEI